MLKLDIYCESAPLADDQVSYGLTRVMTAISHALSNEAVEILVLPVDGLTLPQHIHKQARPLTKLGSNLIAKIISKLQQRTPIVAQTLFKIWAHWNRSNRGSPPFLLAVIGANYRTLLRAQELAKIRKQNLIVYLVDDLVIPAKGNGSDIQLVSESIKNTLHSVNKIYCITKTLGERNKRLFGVTSAVLDLPFLPTPNSAPTQSKHQLIYVGAVNFLYASTLQLLIKKLSEYNTRNTIPLTLRLTVQRSIAERSLGALPSWVIAEPIPDSGDLRREIGASIAAVLPYSFHPEHREMVETSFPSKLLDYLYSAKKIITIAPEYSSVAEYFKNQSWMKIETQSFSIEDIINSTKNAPDQRDSYRAHLFERHSLDVFRQQLAGPGTVQ